MKQASFLSTLLAAMLAAAVVLLLRGWGGGEPAGPGPPGIRLVEREGRPWVYWAGSVPSSVVFQMENCSRFETIGVAREARLSHVVELAGWLGRGVVRVHARPELGEAPPPLEVHPRQIEATLDRLAEAVVEHDDRDAWKRLGRFAELYFTSGVGRFETKKRLQSRLVDRRADAGPGGARWLWGAGASPTLESSLPGSPRLGGTEPWPRSAGPNDAGIVLRLPAVDFDQVELELQVEVSPTPADGYWIVATLGSGWKALLEPAGTGGVAYQRLDSRALGQGGTDCVLTVHTQAESSPDLRISLVGAGLRYLPRDEEGPDAGR